jgi:hypothetical protein
MVRTIYHLVSLNKHCKYTLFNSNFPDRRVNADEFNRRFRHVACAALVREKVDEAAGHLLLVIFFSRSPPKTVTCRLYFVVQ